MSRLKRFCLITTPTPHPQPANCFFHKKMELVQDPVKLRRLWEAAGALNFARGHIAISVPNPPLERLQIFRSSAIAPFRAIDAVRQDRRASACQAEVDLGDAERSALRHSTKDGGRDRLNAAKSHRLDRATGRAHELVAAVWRPAADQ